VFATRQARSFEDETSQTLTLAAVRGALADAGLTIADVDGISLCVGHPARTNRSRASMEGSRLLGGRPHWIGTKFMAIGALLEAASAIAYGNCEVVVVAAGQAGERTTRATTAPWTRPSNPFYECWGLHTAVEWALVAQQHMHAYGTTEEQLATVAATIRNHGSANPEAIYAGRGPFTPGDVLASRMIASPLRLLDCAMTSEGAAGFVVTTVERAAEAATTPVHLLGGAVERQGPSFGLGRPPLLDEIGMVGAWAARKTFAMAGLTPDDVDTCQFYDPFSFEIIRQFEAFGFCAQGEGGPFVMDGRIALGGRFPVCTDGGTLAHSHPGIPASHLRLVEAVRQLRGEAGDRQVPDAQVAMVSTGGSGHLWSDVALLGREPA
jgi:acetyl-CoA acetyltransferase